MGKEINPIKSNLTLKRQRFDKAFKLNAARVGRNSETYSAE